MNEQENFYIDDDGRLWEEVPGYASIPESKPPAADAAAARTGDRPESRPDSYAGERVLAGATPVQGHVDTTPDGLGQHESGAKLDAHKVDMSLLLQFPDALEEVCRVGDYGQQKYTRGGWKYLVAGVRRYTAALLRHLLAEGRGEEFDVDPAQAEYGYEGQIRHAAQVAWNSLARLQLMLAAGKSYAEMSEPTEGEQNGE